MRYGYRDLFLTTPVQSCKQITVHNMQLTTCMEIECTSKNPDETYFMKYIERVQSHILNIQPTS